MRNLYYSTLLVSGLAGALAVSTVRADEVSDLQAELKTEQDLLEKTAAQIEEVKDAIEKEKDNPGGASESSSGEGASGSPMDPEDIADKEAEIDEKAYLAGAYRKGFFASSQLSEGAPMGDLVLADGTSYNACVFVAATKEGLKIKHATGIAFLSGNDLTPELSSKVNVPPHNEERYNLVEVFDSKPDSLKPTDIRKKERDKEAEAKVAARKKEYEEALARNLARKEKRLSGDGESSVEMSDSQKQIRQLTEERTKLILERRELTTSNRDANVEKRAILLSFDRKVVKKDQKTIDGATFQLDNKIRANEARMKEVDERLQAIVLELRKLY